MAQSHTLRRKPRFYGWGEPVFIVLMLFSITINYINGLLIGRWRLTQQKKAKTVLVINVVINLALLGFSSTTTSSPRRLASCRLSTSSRWA